jgi:hypothetical protein
MTFTTWGSTVQSQQFAVKSQLPIAKGAFKVAGSLKNYNIPKTITVFIKTVSLSALCSHTSYQYRTPEFTISHSRPFLTLSFLYHFLCRFDLSPIRKEPLFIGRKRIRKLIW